MVALKLCLIQVYLMLKSIENVQFKGIVLKFKGLKWCINYQMEIGTVNVINVVKKSQTCVVVRYAGHIDKMKTLLHILCSCFLDSTLFRGIKF